MTLQLSDQKQMILKQLLTIDNNDWFLFIIVLIENMKRCTPMLLFMMLSSKDMCL